MIAKELRLGNLIASSNKLTRKNKKTWVVGKVHCITSSESQFEEIEVETKDDFTWFFRDDYFGIPLTEEWLLKFGFEKTDESNHLFSGEWREYNHKAICDYFEIWESVEQNKFFLVYQIVITDTWVRYVHQLQNLFFALTGEELTLKNGR